MVKPSEIGCASSTLNLYEKSLQGSAIGTWWDKHELAYRSRTVLKTEDNDESAFEGQTSPKPPTRRGRDRPMDCDVHSAAAKAIDQLHDAQQLPTREWREANMPGPSMSRPFPSVFVQISRGDGLTENLKHI